MQSVAAASKFIRPITSSTAYLPDDTRETTKDLAVWTLAHRGYSGNGRLAVWVFPSKAAALREGAVLALEAGLDEDLIACAAFDAGRYQQVLDRYEQGKPAELLLRVQPAFFVQDVE